MKIALISDTHCEIEEEFIHINEFVDLIIFAGDIHKAKHVNRYVEQYLPYTKEIIFVAGNHEFWSDEYFSCIKKMRETTTNVHFLENDYIDIGNYRFIGATAWTDFKFGGNGNVHLNMMKAGNGMRDYNKIRYNTGKYRKLKPDDVSSINLVSKQYIFDTIRNSEKDCVVITHHAPTKFSIHEKYERDELNCAYVNTWENDICYADNLKYWFHGHLHDSTDHTIGNCRIICNPRDYPNGQERKNFLILDI